MPHGDTTAGVAEVLGQRSQNQESAGSKTSTSHARTVRYLAEWFEQRPAPPSRMPLFGVPGCPGRNYGDVFRAAANPILGDATASSYIYYGGIESFDDYSSGIFIRFMVSGYKQPLGVWLAKDLEPRDVFAELTGRLRNAADRFRLYALGAFESKFNGAKYSIELERLAYTWITMKGEN